MAPVRAGADPLPAATLFPLLFLAAWYGGGRPGKHLTHYTYWSCSWVAIRGGRSTATWQPRFVPALDTVVSGPTTRHGNFPAALEGFGTPTERATMCLSAVNDIGVCDDAGPKCEALKTLWMRPRQFEGTSQPTPLRQSDY